MEIYRHVLSDSTQTEDVSTESTVCPTHLGLTTDWDWEEHGVILVLYSCESCSLRLSDAVLYRATCTSTYMIDPSLVMDPFKRDSVPSTAGATRVDELHFHDGTTGA